jgi:uncharacterized membrane protein
MPSSPASCGNSLSLSRLKVKIRRAASIILVLYAVFTAYAVLAVIRGVGFQPILTSLNTTLAFSFAILHGSQRFGWKRTLLLLGITFAVSLTFESIGVATGWIYGSYHYTDKLGVKFLGLVPLLIPLAWFMMSYPSFIIALQVIHGDLSQWRWRIATAVVGSLAMTAWDLAMDPMMVAGGHWVWDEPGAYFNIPIHNYAGWWVTIFVVFFLFFIIGKITPANLVMVDPSYDRQATLSYAITGLSTIIVDIQIGLAGPALVGIFAMLPWVILGWPFQKKQKGGKYAIC